MAGALAAAPPAPPAPAWYERAFAFLDDDAAGTRPARIAAFAVILALIIGSEYWARALPKWHALAPLYLASLAAATLLCGAALYAPWRRAAFAGLALTQAVVIWQEFPAAGNHAYLELVFCLLCATLGAQRDEQILFVRAVRWLVCVVFFYGGLQKLVHGYWLHGEYLAFSLTSPSFRGALGPLLPPGELARLTAFSGAVGDGPYRVASPLFVALSQATVLAELALAPALLWRRTRALAVGAALALLAAIELGAREVFFGLVFANAILLFLQGTAHRRLVPVFAVVLALLLLVRLGVLPDVVFY